LGQGANEDISAFFSMIVGALSSQTYIQAIFSAKSLKEARKGALISSFLIPPVGLCCVIVGLYMRINFPDSMSDQVLPVFIIRYLPPFAGGVMLASLLIVVIGSWAGLTLSLTTMLSEDIIKKYLLPKTKQIDILKIQRIVILLISFLSMLFIIKNINSIIMMWSILALGLRACAIFFPLIGAVFFQKIVTPAAGITSALLGPLTALIWRIVFPKGLSPVYPGLFISLLSLLFISLFSKVMSHDHC